MTAVLRHVPDLIWFGLLQPLCHVVVTSAAASPVFVKTDNYASYVHTAIRFTPNRRLPLYARRTQT
jgi:hypothetical protein